MAKQLQLRRGTTTEHNTFTGADGEVTVDTNKKTVVVHDGITAGGFPVASRANADGTISLLKKDGTSAGTINSDGLFNNTLTSTNTNQALTAAQGKVLKDTLDNVLSSPLGVGQTWQDVTSVRVESINYMNTTGKPILINILVGGNDGDSDAKLFVDGIKVGVWHCGYGTRGTITLSAIVPNNVQYRLETGSYIDAWTELR